MTGRGRKRGLQDEKAIEVIGIIAKNNRKKRKKKKINVTYQKDKKKRGIITE